MTDLQSPFLHVLHSNYVPTDEEVVEIRAFCRQPELDIAAIDAEIEIITKNLESLKLQRSGLEAIVTPYQQLLSPLRRLSPEVIQRIFRFRLPADRNPVMHHSDAPLLLGRVCRTWRQITFNIAELWASIHVVIPSTQTSPDLSQARLDGVIKWLSRQRSICT
ncbi:hypothetical protein C8J56DRAFT_1166660 [Mycena floridula]|nr:hypothetical protein C8J56DRAFT_1166660 [Mycena floridula]